MFIGFRFIDPPDPPRLFGATLQTVRGNVKTMNHCFASEWAIDCSLSDCGRSRRGGEWVPRGPGIVHLYPPGTTYDEDLTNVDVFRSVYAIFSCEGNYLRRLTDNSAGYARITDSKDGKIASLLMECAKVSGRRGTDGFWEATSLFCRLPELLSHLRPCGPGDWNFEFEPENLPSGENMTRTVTAWLEKNYRSHISLEDAARAAGTGVSSLCHKFRKETGETVLEALHRIRAEQSLTALFAGLPLKEIAESTGFANEFHYSRVFRKVFGMPPSEYRKRRP